MTYLNFNDFKTKLIKQPKLLSLLTLELILRASLTQGRNLRIMSIWEKVARFRGRCRGHSLESRTMLTQEVLQKGFGDAVELQRQHPFLLYTSSTGYTVAPPLRKRKHRTGVFGKGYCLWKMDQLRHLGSMMNGCSAIGKQVNGSAIKNTLLFFLQSNEARLGF